MVPLPASPIVCAPSSAASARHWPLLPILLRPSAQPLLSCSFFSQHALDNLHAHSASCLSHTLHAPSLSLCPWPSPQVHCLCCQSSCTAPYPSELNTS